MIELRTERLRLRPVRKDDADPIVALGSDERVMASLGGVMSPDASRGWLDKQLVHWREHRFGLFFVSRDDRFVGLVGLSRSNFDEGIVPGVEVAWRLVFANWGNGYASEAARAVIDDGEARLGIRDIVAATTLRNARSLAVMKRLGMTPSPSEAFEHPRLPQGSALRAHVVYRRTAR
jgi:RimJ/RimL family protein N-acetyltransferase